MGKVQARGNACFAHSFFIGMLRFLVSRRSCSTLTGSYMKRVSSGKLQLDTDQKEVFASLDETSKEIHDYLKSMDRYWASLGEWETDRKKKLENYKERKSGWFTRQKDEHEIRNSLLQNYKQLLDPNLSNIQKLKQQFIGQLAKGTKAWPILHKELIRDAQLEIVQYDADVEKSVQVEPLPIRPYVPKGIYLYGQVGTGKTMTMSLLLEYLSESLPAERIEVINYSSVRGQEDPIPPSTLSNLPKYSPFSPSASPPPMRLIWAHFSDFVRHCYRTMHYYNNKPLGKVQGEFRDAVDGCIASFVGYRLDRDPSGRLSDVLLDRRLDLFVEQKMKRLRLPPVVIFFDEFQMVDIGDSSVIKAIFQRLISHGSIIITSCNLPPEHLLQFSSLGRDLEQFSDLLCNSMNVFSLPANFESGKSIDYRKKQYDEDKPKDTSLFFEGSSGSCDFNSLFSSIAQEKWEDQYQLEIPMYKRSVMIPSANIERSVCRFTFDELCSNDLSSIDYNAIARQFSVIFIEDIPELSVRIKNEIRRFISLVDQVYNQSSILVCHSKKSIDNMFIELPEEAFDTHEILENLQFERSDDYGKAKVYDKHAMAQFSGKNEKFAFARAQSRLKEMQSNRYLSSRVNLTETILQ